MSVIEELKAAVGADVVLSAAEADLARHLNDFVYSSPSSCTPIGVAYPRSTEDVSAILKICNAAGQTIVPQGGRTGLAGAAVPQAAELILSLERMRAIEEIDRHALTVTVQAGAILETVQQAADKEGLFYPLDIGGRGTCTIGGNVSTNAGGNRVLRYGMTRDLVLGVEAVLADGTIVSSLNKMLKNNTAYDLKQLFIGSEGTLGVVTRVVLKLFPKPVSAATALVAVQSYAQVMELLARARAGLAGTLSAFEAMWADYYAMGANNLKRAAPVALGYPIYVLLDALGSDQASDQARLEVLIGQAIEDGVVDDAAIAQSERDAKDFWSIRDYAGEMNQIIGPTANFDVSVPTGQIADLVAACQTALREKTPDARPVFFGHVADANLHIAVPIGDGMPPKSLVEDTVYDVVRGYGGSVSAEHGIGLSRKKYLSYSRSPAEIGVMRALRQALDPRQILNPGKVLD
jgi:FAD/FMN-containing dehydrogenase